MTTLTYFNNDPEFLPASVVAAAIEKKIKFENICQVGDRYGTLINTAATGYRKVFWEVTTGEIFTADCGWENKPSYEAYRQGC
jgi:hypothetical protein